MSSFSEVVKDVHVGDSGRPVSFVLVHANQKTALNLTGYAARIHFWNGDDPIHLTKPMKVEASIGMVVHILDGDEFTETGFSYAQVEVMTPTWYVGGQIGIAYHWAPTEIVKFNVFERPV